MSGSDLIESGGSNPAATTSERAPSLRAFAGYFLNLGAVGFGGPIALAGYM